MWLYKQSTGTFENPVYGLKFKGYSGQGTGLNNPELEHVPNYGPVPAGVWNIGPAFRHKAKGPVCMRLTRADGSKPHDRDGFLIHGDNKALNKTASEGCIILGLTARQDISQSKDRELIVVP